MAENDKEIVEQAYCAALTKRGIKNKEIRLDGKLSKKLGLRDGNVGRANWDDERNNHIRHSTGLVFLVFIAQVFRFGITWAFMLQI